jgi:hypothetical protein
VRFVPQLTRSFIVWSQLNFGQPLFDVRELAAPDFVMSEPVRPKTAMALVVDDCKLTQHVIVSLLKVGALFPPASFARCLPFCAVQIAD